MTTTRPLVEILADLAGNPPLRKGERYGIKAVHADFESSRGFVWPFPGGTARSPMQPKPGEPCPAFPGDGLCVALTARGATQGGHRLSTVLLVAFGKVYGADEDKVRVASARVLHLFDVPKLAREGMLSGANLSGADLFRADLYGADLRGCDLSGADLFRADLYGADLRGCDLYGAYLSWADLSGADLTRANLFEANLSGAITPEAARRRGAIL